MTDTKSLAGQLILVTGASRGIGRAVAEEVGRRGAHVILTARSAEALEEVEEVIHAAGGSATIAPLDLTENESVSKLANAVASRWDALDGLVLNAAMLGSLAPVPSLDAKELARVFTLNVLAQQALIAAFDPMLRRSRQGKLIAITSRVGSEPTAYWGGYGASKAALENLVRTYADEVENVSPVRCAIVDPGATRTQMRAKAYPGENPQMLKDANVVGTIIAEMLASELIATTTLHVPN